MTDECSRLLRMTVPSAGTRLPVDLWSPRHCSVFIYIVTTNNNTPHSNDTHIPMKLLVALAYLWIREHQRCEDTSQISKTPSRQGLSNTTKFLSLIHI